MKEISRKEIKAIVGIYSQHPTITLVQAREIYFVQKELEKNKTSWKAV